MHTTRRLVYECVGRASAMGPQSALQELPHGRAEHTILPEDKAWVVHLACTQPKTLGYAAELWTRRTLAEHIRKLAESIADFPLSLVWNPQRGGQLVSDFLAMARQVLPKQEGILRLPTHSRAVASQVLA